MFKGFANYQFFYAVAMLVGMIVGAGTFGIPYVFSQAGFSIGFFYLLILGAAVMLIHLFYGEIVLRTNQPYRLVGYAAKYLGPGAKKIVTLIILFEYYGALLAYLILGGKFLAIIFTPLETRFLMGFGGSEFFWVMVFFLLGAAAIFWRLRRIAANEFFMTILLLLAAMVLLVKAAPLINFNNFQPLNLSKFFLPYGVILFALAGSAAVPEMRQVLVGQERKLKRAIFWGTLIPVILYFLFAAVVVGVTGRLTSEEAIGGLVPYFGGWVIILGAVFGFLAVFTSFIVLGVAVRKIYQHDYKIKSLISFLLACFVPLFGYLLGFKNFILIIGFVGAIASGLDGILTVLIYFRAKKAGDRQPEYSLAGAKVLGSLLIFVFTLGLIYQFIYLSGK